MNFTDQSFEGFDNETTIDNNDTVPWNSEFQFSMFYISYNLYALNDSNAHEKVLFGLSESGNIIKFLLQGAILSLFCGLGIIGNILSIIVCFNARMKSSISCLLIGLAICDTTILITCLIMYGVPTILSMEILYPQATWAYLTVGYAASILYPISVTAYTGSVYFTLAITLERYLIVCNPFLARRICTWRRASQASIGIGIGTIIYNIPRFFEQQCDPVYDMDGQRLGCSVLATEMRKNEAYRYYTLIAYLIVHFIIPMSCLVLFNILIYLKIREANKGRRNLSVSDVKENSLTLMLFVVVCVFFICNFAFGLFSFYFLINWGQPVRSPKPIGLFISTFLIILNSSVNFLIYCIYGEKFREVFCDMVSQPWRRLTSRKRSNSDWSEGTVSKTISSATLQSSVGIGTPIATQTQA